MRMMNELNHMFLYSANKKVYVPIDESDRRRNSAILLLTPNLKASMHLTMLPYLHNPSLFTSFYIDRNIGAVINKASIEGFDEKEANIVSEAMVHASNGTKFKFDKVSTMDERYIRDVYNKDTVKYYANLLELNKVPDRLTVVVHPSVSNLRSNSPNYIKNNCGDDYFSYSSNDEIHIITKMVYDPFSMRGDFKHYLLSELLYTLIIHFNPDIPYKTAMGIAFAFSGIHDYMEREKNNSIQGGSAMEFSQIVANIIDKGDIDVIKKYIRTNNLNLFAKYAIRSVIKSVRKSLFEGTLSYSDRQKLLPSDFGIPNKRMYPIHDEDHVRAAIRMFNNCDPDDEKELAEAIIKKMKKYNITDMNIGPNNRFGKYYKKSKILEESAYKSLERYPCKPISSKLSYKWIDNKYTNLDEDEYGEYIFDEDKQYPIAFYVTKKLDDQNVYITDIETIEEYKESIPYLIARAMDRQNADYALINRNSKLYDIFIKSGFKPFGKHEDGRIKLTIKDSIAEGIELDADWDQIKSVCAHLDPSDISRISFTDKYENSKFVIKRYIGRVGGKDKDGNPAMIPAGFLDLYQFPSNPSIAQITIAVDNRYRGLGVAKSMVRALMDDRMELAKMHGFNILYWTAHPDNDASKYLAERVGRFTDTGKIDKYGRKVYVKYIDDENSYLNLGLNKNSLNESGSIVESNESIFLFEADSPDYSAKLKKYLYSERIRTDKEVLLLYKEAKSYNPYISKTYLKLAMYKKLNLFVDLSYYHALFLKNNTLRLDNGVNFYFDFLNKLINNKEIISEYSKRTIFIPVDREIWNIQPDDDMTDYKTNLNPISVIFRLIRTNPGALRREWGNKNIIFVGTKGYFTIDFNTFDTKDLPKLKIILRKLNNNELISDDEYVPGDTAEKDTAKAIATNLIDKIEANNILKIDDISSINSLDQKTVQGTHLKITSGPIDVGNRTKENSGIAIVSLDPEGPDAFEKLSKTVLSAYSNSITTYCMPK